MSKRDWNRPQFRRQGKLTEERSSKPKYPDAADRFLAAKEKKQEKLVTKTETRPERSRHNQKNVKKNTPRTFEDLDPARSL